MKCAATPALAIAEPGRLPLKSGSEPGVIIDRTIHWGRNDAHFRLAAAAAVTVAFSLSASAQDKFEVKVAEFVGPQHS